LYNTVLPAGPHVGIPCVTQVVSRAASVLAICALPTASLLVSGIVPPGTRTIDRPPPSDGLIVECQFRWCAVAVCPRRARHRASGASTALTVSPRPGQCHAASATGNMINSIMALVSYSGSEHAGHHHLYSTGASPQRAPEARRTTTEVCHSTPSQRQTPQTQTGTSKP
jgi:hypothetical protein